MSVSASSSRLLRILSLARGISTTSMQLTGRNAAAATRPLAASVRRCATVAAPVMRPMSVPSASRALGSFAAGPVSARRSLATKAAATEAPEETFQYQAEVDRLMDMIVNSLYSNREVFLRELISNASDALDKARFTSLTNPDMMKGREELEIRVSCDKAKQQITIEDSGIGMTKAQLLDNLGTIARSGTRKFMEMMKEAKGDNNLIGQFGVGFYSAFLVSDRVTVITRSADEDKQWIWSAAAGSHEFSVKEDTSGESLVRGTRVILHCKEDAAELCDPVMLARLIKQYSQFISFPIKLYQPKKDPIKVPDDEATARKQEAADKKALEDGKETAPVEPVMKTEYVETSDWRTQNENKPIWMRAPKDVTPESYNEFFKQTFSEFLDPLAHQHFNVEGTIEFSGILYIPGMAPFDQQQGQQAKSRSIKLYVKRVFISDEFDENLMPRYLSFIKGVVDSSDLPLNVSREILQESRITRMIRKQLVKRSIDMITDLAGQEGGEDYRTFWESFGRNLKVGVIEDTENREKLAKLVRFFSSAATEEGKLTSFDEYVARMKQPPAAAAFKQQQGAAASDVWWGEGWQAGVCEEGKPTSFGEYVARMKAGQKGIYYMAADSLDASRSSPFVEKLISKGYEVLFLTDPVDEAMVSSLAKYGDHELVDVSKDGLTMSDTEDEKKAAEAVSKEFADVVDFLKKALGEKVEAVKVSDRLTDSPCALVTSKFGWSANMERLMKSQAFGDQRTMEYMKGRKIMEINPEHDIIRGFKTLLAENDEDRARDLAEILYDTSLLTSGFAVESPRDYAARVFTMMKIVLGYEITEPAAASSSPAAAESNVVEPEVIDPSNPWAGKKHFADILRMIF
ncbi:hypothetical protein FOA52_005954 [Chlamydomonas sp. UWO 241]|nr:hypothetical protein FOA52_005954 [Chlamydomonas sp. UWO 241]